jgi:UDP-N-acetylmuramoyl-tripeptide--D-alanyl-D-alanine ligase
MLRLKSWIIGVILWYLRACARLHLRIWRPTIIGIAGSSGKTSLAHLATIVLEGRLPVRQSKGKNSETGIPLDVLGLSLTSYSVYEWIRILLAAPFAIFRKEQASVYVVEMGIDGPFPPKNMAYLASVIQPHVVAVTNVSMEHSMYFDSLVRDVPEHKREKALLQHIAYEETYVLTQIPTVRAAIVNADDVWIRKTLRTIQATSITVSQFRKDAEYRLLHFLTQLDQCAMEIMHRGKSYVLNIKQGLPEAYSFNFMMAIAIGEAMDVPIDVAIRRLEVGFSLPAGRATLFEGIRQTTLIDSSYNATPQAMEELAMFTRTLARKRRTLCIVGDMRELGSMSKLSHEHIAHVLARTMNQVILIGPLMHNYCYPVLKRLRVPVLSFPNVTKAYASIREAIREQDVILIKGSQNTLFLERVVEMLLAKTEDKEKLCRRGPVWDSKRTTTP